MSNGIAAVSHQRSAHMLLKVGLWRHH